MLLIKSVTRHGKCDLFHGHVAVYQAHIYVACKVQSKHVIVAFCEEMNTLCILLYACLLAELPESHKINAHVCQSQEST